VRDESQLARVEAGGGDAVEHREVGILRRGRYLGDVHGTRRLVEDEGVRVRAPDDGHMQRPGDVDVRDVGALPGHQDAVRLHRDAGADEPARLPRLS